MQKKAYKMTQQLRIGNDYEKTLDTYLGKWYNIEQASREQQRNGIDRILRAPSGMIFATEYKADEKAHKTGNVFIETVSVDTEEKKGWIYTSSAQLLIYYIPQEQTVYFVNMTTLKKVFQSEWQSKYPVEPVDNIDENGEHAYYAYGICVPLNIFKSECVLKEKILYRSKTDEAATYEYQSHEVIHERDN